MHVRSRPSVFVRGHRLLIHGRSQRSTDEYYGDTTAGVNAPATAASIDKRWELTSAANRRMLPIV